MHRYLSRLGGHGLNRIQNQIHHPILHLVRIERNLLNVFIDSQRQGHLSFWHKAKMNTGNSESKQTILNQGAGSFPSI